MRLPFQASSAALLCIVVVGCVHRLPTNQMNVRDGFEGKTLSALWRTDKLAEGALTMQSEQVRFGQRAARITIHPHDPNPESSSDGTERDELQEADACNVKENETYAYEFSLFIPKEFPVVPKRLVLAQWKQRHGKARVSVDNPLVALRYKGGELSITIQTQAKKVVHYRTMDDIKGRWLDFVCHIRHSRNKDGIVRVWMNGSEILDFRGATAYSEDFGYPPGASFYFKMGLYRDDMIEPMTIYIDEFRKRRITENETR